MTEDNCVKGRMKWPGEEHKSQRARVRTYEVDGCILWPLDDAVPEDDLVQRVGLGAVLGDLPHGTRT